MQDFTSMTMPEIAKLDGINDLQVKQKLFFAKALRAEAAGDQALAEEMLAKAISEK